jgi:hypothetical protein
MGFHGAEACHAGEGTSLPILTHSYIRFGIRRAIRQPFTA